MPDSPYFPTIEINLAAIARNYALMNARLGRGKAGAVVKANAYGLGAARAAPVLYGAGCHDFFVATLDEAVEVRNVLSKIPPPEGGRIKEGVKNSSATPPPGAYAPTSPLKGEEVSEANIYVFHGARKGQSKDFLAHRLIPVLNSVEQISQWDNAGLWALHIDTGMNRLGIAPEEAEEVAKKWLGKGSGLCLVMSHLACASDPESPKNKEQLELFRGALRHFPGIPVSFANSSGIMLGPEYQFDLARTGRALYGITRGAKTPADMENVVELTAPVLQYRTIHAPQSVGYGATAQVKPGTVLATVELGYADGFLRTLSHKIHGYAGGIRLPVIGLVSMDMVMVDVSAVPAHLRGPQMRITFIGKEQPIDLVAEAAGTIGYEIFTRLGTRVRKIYTQN